MTKGVCRFHDRLGGEAQTVHCLLTGYIQWEAARREATVLRKKAARRTLRLRAGRP